MIADSSGALDRRLHRAERIFHARPGAASALRELLQRAQAPKRNRVALAAEHAGEQHPDDGRLQQHDQRAADVAQLLRDDSTYIYVCGLNGMEDGVLQSLKDIADRHGLEWGVLWQKLNREGRLHLETY